MEGLAYLTFDADVKEEFVEDEAALKALFQLSRVALRVLQSSGTLSSLSWPLGGRSGSPGGRTVWDGHTGQHQECQKRPCLEELGRSSA